MITVLTENRVARLTEEFQVSTKKIIRRAKLVLTCIRSK